MIAQFKKPDFGPVGLRRGGGGGGGVANQIFESPTNIHLVSEYFRPLKTQTKFDIDQKFFSK